MTIPTWLLKVGPLLADLLQLLIDLWRRHMSTPTPFQSPLPAGVPVTAHNVLALLGSDLVQGAAGPLLSGLAAIQVIRADTTTLPAAKAVKVQAVVATTGAQLVDAGLLTFEQMLGQLAQLGGYGITKLEASATLTPPAAAPSSPGS